jgi:hypothetical protein
MSSISRNTTKFKVTQEELKQYKATGKLDAVAFVAALQAIGYHPEVNFEKALQMGGYGGQKANIIVRAKEIRSTYSSDLGWVVNADGTLDELHDFDGRSDFDDRKRRHLTAAYTEAVGVKKLAALGLKPYKFTINAKGQKEFEFIKA